MKRLCNKDAARFSCSTAHWRAGRSPGDTWGARLHLHHTLLASSTTPFTSSITPFDLLLPSPLSPLHFPTLPTSGPYFLTMSLSLVTSLTSFSISTSFTSQSSPLSPFPLFHHPLYSSPFLLFYPLLMTIPSSSAPLPTFTSHLFLSSLFHPCSPPSLSSSPSSSTPPRSLHLKSLSSFLFRSRHPLQSGLSACVWVGEGGVPLTKYSPSSPCRPPIHLSAAPPQWGGI